MNSVIVSDGTVPWPGNRTSRISRIPVTSSSVGIRRSRSAISENLQHMGDADRSNGRTTRSIASGNRSVYTVTGELEIQKIYGRKAAEMSRPKMTTSRPFSVDSSPSSLSSSAVEEPPPPPPPPPPVDERLNAAMEKLFELYRRQERRGSLGGSDTDASLSGGGRGLGGGVDVTAELEPTMTSGRVRSRRKRRIPVRRTQSSLLDKSRSFSHDSVQPSAVYSETTPNDEGIGSDRLNTNQQRHSRHARSPVRDGRGVTYKENHLRVARKFVPPKATGVVLGLRSRSCGLTRDGSLREASSSRYPDASTRAHPRTRSHESFRSTGHRQKPGADRDHRDARGTERETSKNTGSYEPRRSRYESHRMRSKVAIEIPKSNNVDHDDMEAMLKSERRESRRNQASDLLRSTSTRGRYRSDEALNRESFRNTQRAEGLRKDTRPTGSMSRIPLTRTFNTMKKPLTETELGGSGSDSDLEQVRSRLPVRRGHPEESIGNPLDPGTILISNQSLWFVNQRHRSHPPRLEQVALPAGLDHLVRSIMLKHLMQPKSSGSNSTNYNENSSSSNDSNSRNVSCTDH